MIRYHAPWILPISCPPIRDGWFSIDDGRIVAVGDGTGTRRGHAEELQFDLGDVAVLPGLVNAHTHLELSYLRDQVPPASDFVTWIRAVMAARRQRPEANSPEILDAVDAALRECLTSGTAVVGDISNTLVTFDPLARSLLAAVVFYELIRFKASDAVGLVDAARREIGALRATDHVRPGLAAHAPYSVAPLVMRAIRQGVEHDPAARWSIHVSESAAEVEFVHGGRGPWRGLLEEVRGWDPAWVVPGVSPVQFLDDSGFLDAHVLAVHGAQMTAADLRRLAARGTPLVSCPRSNAHTGAGAPPIASFYEASVNVAIGTDSLASTADLNMFGELAAIRALAPEVPARMLLESATLQGARALGFDAEFGSIHPGKLARVIAVEIPAVTDDVEEYLVSGIRPEQIRWVE